MSNIKHSQYFNKTKEDHQKELIEDYVEEIADLFRTHGEVRSADLAARMGVSAPAVSKVINRLKAEGLVESVPYRGIFLTAEGKALAEKVAYRHSVVFRTLIKLGVSDATANADAEGIEHHCSEETVEAMTQFLSRR